MVSFVGAGPGAGDLITVRGMRRLEKAQVIIYAGSLVSEELLQWAGPDCQIHNSAKMNLDEIIEVMKKAHEDGLDVVRLHTGDPSLYGAIREQMDRLDALGISYEIVPGVSSFCGAAAALKAEYTLPKVSQSVIITRMEGRTGVPESEKLSELAKHKATMVIFLSASMTDLVASELIKGGYGEDTPAAIVYKATWPEEKIIRCTLGTLHRCAREENITNHALIAVGYFLGKDYELSRLYDSGFSTGFRKASTKETVRVSLISFSDRGSDVAKNIGELLRKAVRRENNSEGFEEEKIVPEITDIYRCEEGRLNEWTAKHFREDDVLIFIGACGIATRAIAPYINHKSVDPAVLVVDELAQNVIPLLSGHIGGANRLSEVIAKELGAGAVLTTATDLHGAFAVDTWALEHHMTIQNPEYIKKVSAKVLRGEEIIIDTPIRAEHLPKQVKVGANHPDVVISYKNVEAQKLILIPKAISVGIGCKKDTPAEEIEKLWNKILGLHNINPRAIKQICSIDLKAKEPGLLRFAERKNLPLRTFSAEELNALTGDYASSEFVKSVAGVDCVCERSAVLGAGETSDACLIVRKIAENGVTIALAIQRKI